MSLKKLQHHKISLLAEILLTFNARALVYHPGAEPFFPKGNDTPGCFSGFTQNILLQTNSFDPFWRGTIRLKPLMECDP